MEAVRARICYDCGERVGSEGKGTLRKRADEDGVVGISWGLGINNWIGGVGNGGGGEDF